MEMHSERVARESGAELLPEGGLTQGLYQLSNHQKFCPKIQWVSAEA